MAFLLLEDGFCDHPKIVSLSHQAFRLHVCGLNYCSRNLTDGVLTVRAVQIVTATAGVAARYVKELRDAGLWKPHGSDLVIHDYLSHNPTAEQVKAKREQAAERKRRWRESHRDDNGQFSRDETQDGTRDATRYVTPPHPIPSHNPIALAMNPNTLRGNDAHASGTTWERLVRACGNDHDTLLKLKRASKGSTEADHVAALEACTGTGVNDRLAVALSVLKRRRDAA